jgi:hypothetical protein
LRGDDRQQRVDTQIWRPFNHMDPITMSKSTRHADNSKRQQPTKQAQRAQARQPGSGGSGPVKSEADEQQQKPEKKSDAGKQR